MKCCFPSKIPLYLCPGRVATFVWKRFNADSFRHLFVGGKGYEITSTEEFSWQKACFFFWGGGVGVGGRREYMGTGRALSFLLLDRSLSIGGWGG